MAVIVCLTMFYVFYIAEKYIVLYLQKYTMNFVITYVIWISNNLNLFNLILS